MAYQFLNTEIKNGVFTVSLNRPKVNALNTELLSDLSEVCNEIRASRHIRVVIFRSSMDNFCAGADLKERSQMSEADVKQFVKYGIGAVIHKIGDIEVPTIAAVKGNALGGGCELALACDFRVLSQDAQIGLRETALGIIPGAGGTQRLPRLIGYSKALYWILTAKVFTAEEALRDGVANTIVDPNRLDATVLNLANEILANAPIAIRQAKKAVRMGLGTSLQNGLEIENECYNAVIHTKDRQEALIAFGEKRTPTWTNS